MEILKNLFYGFPDLWGGGVAHSVMILSLVIALGLCLGKLRVKGVSLGLAWILFIGLILDISLSTLTSICSTFSRNLA